MVARCFVLAGMVALTGLAVESAPALDESQGAFPQNSAVEGVLLKDEFATRPQWDFGWREDAPRRFSAFSSARAEPGFASQDGSDREFIFAAPHTSTGFGLDVEVAQRAGFGADANGDIDRTRAGAEVRLGRNLTDRIEPWRESEEGSWYIFAASDGQALTWTPESEGLVGQRGLRLQDRVTIGDTQVGVTYERNGFQTSLGYTAREVSYERAAGGYSEDESFAGLTLTWRR
ncbi:MAG: hypothetical protein AB7O04_11885 [Hyphomonadaceae bacterium]